MSRRVLLDPRELEQLAETAQHVHHRHRVIRTKLAARREELHLDSRWAPDAQTSARLRALLDAAEQALAPVAAGALQDAATLRRTASLARRADEAPARRLTPEQVTALLAGQRDPVAAAVLEAQLLGGIRRAEDAYVADELEREERGERDAGAGAPAAAGGAAAAAAAVLEVARGELGTREQGDNRTRYGRWFGMDGQPWCAMFVSWAFAKAGHPLPALQSPKGFAGVRAGAEALREKGLLLERPRVGSIWLHRGATWQSDHTGIVTAVHADGSFSTVEGNASDRVLERRHPASEVRSSYGFGWVLGR